HFYARRALRIWPVYTVVLLFALLVAWRIPHLEFEVTPRLAWAHALYVQNRVFPGTLGPWPLNLTWSLAVEEQFYVMWPLLVALVPERALGRVLWTVVAGMPLVRWAALAAGATPLTIYTHTACRLDGLAVGGLLALAVTRSGGAGAEALLRRFRWGAWLVPPVLALLWSPLLGGDSLIGRTSPVHGAELVAAGGIYTPLALGFAGVVALLLGEGAPAPARAAFSPRWLRWLGTRSYGLYLYHSSTLHLDQLLLRPWLREHLGSRLLANAAGLGLSLAALVLLAEASFRFFERPLLSLRSRFQPAPPAANSVGAGA